MTFVTSFSLRSIMQNMLVAAGEHGIFTAQVNDIVLNVPAGSLAMYPHCLHASVEQPLRYYLSPGRMRWMAGMLSPGDLAVDVGASTGLMSTGLAARVGPAGQVVAFEPARRASGLFKNMLRLNTLGNIRLVGKAVGGEEALQDFTEYAFDPADALAARPDASSLHPSLPGRADTYTVPVTTLDAHFAGEARTVRLLKVSACGQELDVLRGGRALLDRDRPCLAISLAPDPERPGMTTEPALGAFLEPLGYRCELLDGAIVAVGG